MKRVLLSLVLIGGVFGSANALSFIKWVGTGAGQNATTSGHVSAMYGFGATNYSHNGFTGVITAQFGFGATAGSATYGSTFNTFCITPNNNLGSGGNPWEANMTTFAGGNLAYSGGNTLSMYDAMARLVGNNTLWAQATSNNDAATAMQIVLWELEQTGGGNAFATNFSNAAGSVASVQAYYNTFKAAALNSSASGIMYIFVPNPNNQSQVLITNGGGGGGNFTPTPEPFTMGLGIAAAAAFARRRIKAKKLA